MKYLVTITASLVVEVEANSAQEAEDKAIYGNVTDAAALWTERDATYIESEDEGAFDVSYDYSR